jgi:hypothetical protein
MIKRFLANQLILEALKKSMKMNVKAVTKSVKRQYEASQLKTKVEETKEKYEQSDLKLQVEETKKQSQKFKTKVIQNAQEFGLAWKLKLYISYEELIQLSRQGFLQVQNHDSFYLIFLESSEPIFTEKMKLIKLDDEALLSLMKEKEYQNEKYKIKIK